MDHKKVLRYVIIVLSVALIITLLYFLRSAFIPVFVAVFLAYLLDPLIDKLEARRINRTISIFILAAVITVLVVLVGGFLLVQAQRELVLLIKNLPHYLERVQGFADPMAQKYLGVGIPKTFDEAFDEIKGQLGNIDPSSLKPVSQGISKVFSSTVAFVTWLVGLVVIPVFLFYFLRDFDRLKVEVVEYIPLAYREWLVEKLKEVDAVLSAFLRGQLTVCLILGMLYSIGLLIVNVNLAVVIGMGAGIAFIVPYLGTVLGIVTATIMVLLESGLNFWRLFGVALVFIVVQSLEATVITPRIVGGKVGLSPVEVIFAVMVGANLLGFLGVLIAVPVAAVLNVFIKEALANYRKSKFFLDTGAGT